MSRPAGTAKYVRADGLEKVTGQARYAADLLLPGMLEGRFLLAGRAHARIKGIDAGKARRLPGVVAVITQADVPQLRYGSAVKDRTLFADGVIRFEGEVIAAVAARTAEIATAALELIEVDAEPLPPVTDPEAALQPETELVHPDWSSYTAYDGLVRSGNDCAYVTIAKGDVAAGFARADRVIEERYTCDQSHPVPIEPHAVLAQWQGDKVTIWSTSQVPFAARAGVAETLQMPESNVRIIVPHLGGGFGGKCEFHFEAHVAALARKAGRPVRIVFNRHEEFLAPDKVNHPMVIDLKTGVTRGGMITARSARIILDTGAYASDAPSIAEIATMMAAGPYDIPNLDITAHTVYTNKTPAGSVRAPSGPQVAWAVEQHTDEVGRQVGLNGYEIRMRNLLEDGDEGPTGQRMKAVGANVCLVVQLSRRVVGQPQGEHRRVGNAGHGRPGERFWCCDGPGADRGRRARDQPRSRLGSVPRHRRRGLGHGQLGQPDDVQQRPGRDRRRGRGPAANPIGRCRKARSFCRRPGDRQWRPAGARRARHGDVGRGRGGGRVRQWRAAHCAGSRDRRSPAGQLRRLVLGAGGVSGLRRPDVHLPSGARRGRLRHRRGPGAGACRCP